MSKTYRQFRCILTVKSTAKAYLIRNGHQLVWVPKSLCKHITKMAPDQSGEREAVFEVEEWWCDKNGV